MSGWDCDTCTYHNNDTDRRCDMCNALRPITPATDVTIANTTINDNDNGNGDGSNVSTWICATCTLMNESYATRCDACGSDNPNAVAAAATRSTAFPTPASSVSASPSSPAVVVAAAAAVEVPKVRRPKYVLPMKTTGSVTSGDDTSNSSTVTAKHLPKVIVGKLLSFLTFDCALIASSVCCEWHDVVDNHNEVLTHINFDRHTLSFVQRRLVTDDIIINVIQRAGHRIQSLIIAPHVTVIPFEDSDMRDIMTTLCDAKPRELRRLGFASFANTTLLADESFVSSIIIVAPICVSLDTLSWISYGNNAMGMNRPVAGVSTTIQKVIDRFSEAKTKYGRRILLDGFIHNGICAACHPTAAALIDDGNDDTHGDTTKEVPVTLCASCGEHTCVACFSVWLRCDKCESRCCPWRDDIRRRVCHKCHICRYPRLVATN